MALLTPQELHIPLVTGLNESVDEKIAPEGTLTVARNVRIDRAGRLVKRDGYARSVVAESGTGVMTHGKSVLIGDGSAVMRVVPGSTVPPQFAGRLPVADVTRDFLPTDADVLPDSGEWWKDATTGYGLVAWCGDDGCWAVIYDATTGNHVYTARLSTVPMNGDVRVVSAANGIFVVATADISSPFGDSMEFYGTYLPGTNLPVTLANVATFEMEPIPAARTIAGSYPIRSGRTWDVCAALDKLILAWDALLGSPFGGTVSMYKAAKPPLVELDRDEGGFESANLALCAGNLNVPPTGGQFFIARRKIAVPGTGELYCERFAWSGDTFSPPYSDKGVLHDVPTGDIHHLGGVVTGGSSIWFWTEYQTNDTVAMSRMYWNVGDPEELVPRDPTSIPHLVPISRPFKLGEPIGYARVFVHCAHAETECSSDGDNPVSFDYAASPWLYSDVLMATAGSAGIRPPTELSMAATLSTGITNVPRNRTPIPRSVALSLDGTASWSWYDLSLGYQTYAPYKLFPLGVELGGYKFEGNVTRYRAKPGGYAHVSVSGQTMSSSGVAKVWGKGLGNECIEGHPPRIMAFDTYVTSGGLTLGGTYTYAAVWEWYSGGVRYQSEPSVAQSVTMPGSGAGATARIWVEAPAVGSIGLQAGTLVLYRSVSDGGAEGVLYRVRDGATSTVEAVTDAGETPYYVFVDTEPDTAILPNEIIYTVSQLANNAVPGGPCVAGHKGRVWVGGGLDEWRLYYSQPARQGLPPRWNLAMYIDVPAELSVRALASAGDVLAVFGEDAIYIILGDGPNELGIPADSFRVQLLVSGVGAVDQRSVVETPAGIFFASGAGLRLLTRGLEVIPVGESVQDAFSAGECTAAFYNQANEETRFCIAGGDVVVFNHTSNAWTTERLAGAGTGSIIGGGVAGGLIAFADDEGSVYVQTPGEYVDQGPEGSGDVYMTIESAWLKMGAFTGFKRLWWLHLLGEYVSPHSIEVDMTSSYTDGSSLKTTHAWTDAELAALDHYELRVHLLYQRADAYKVTIREGASSVEDDVGAGFQLNAFGLLFGTRGTLAKLPAGASK